MAEVEIRTRHDPLLLPVVLRKPEKNPFEFRRRCMDGRHPATDMLAMAGGDIGGIMTLTAAGIPAMDAVKIIARMTDGEVEQHEGCAHIENALDSKNNGRYAGLNTEDVSGILKALQALSNNNRVRIASPTLPGEHKELSVVRVKPSAPLRVSRRLGFSPKPRTVTSRTEQGSVFKIDDPNDYFREAARQARKKGYSVRPNELVIIYSQHEEATLDIIHQKQPLPTSTVRIGLARHKVVHHL